MFIKRYIFDDGVFPNLLILEYIYIIYQLRSMFIKRYIFDDGVFPNLLILELQKMNITDFVFKPIIYYDVYVPTLVLFRQYFVVIINVFINFLSQ